MGVLLNSRFSIFFFMLEKLMLRKCSGDMGGGKLGMEESML